VLDPGARRTELDQPRLHRRPHPPSRPTSNGGRCIRRLLASVSRYAPRSPRECRKSGNKVLPGTVVAEAEAALDPPDPPGVQPPGASGHGWRGGGAIPSQSMTSVASGPP
jgi:hypothetical protein